jgi:hypothetical protein
LHTVEGHEGRVKCISFSREALAKRLRVAGCIYTPMRSQVALGG